jgi:hypothetical protein
VFTPQPRHSGDTGSLPAEAPRAQLDFMPQTLRLLMTQALGPKFRAGQGSVGLCRGRRFGWLVLPEGLEWNL